ncbi:MAG TPA: M28 family metallopeptidase [Terriglobales bacterium]
MDRGNQALATAVILMVFLAACAQGLQSHASAPATDPSGVTMLASHTVGTVEGQFDAARAMRYLRDVVAFGPRPPASAAHRRLESYLQSHIASDNLEVDSFLASTLIGKVSMTNLIARFPGDRDGIIVIAAHYDTAGTVPNFVGANDGGSGTALLLELSDQLRNRRLKGYSVWLVWLDGEEAVQKWSNTDGLYGSRQLAKKWHDDGTAARIKACLVTDMIGDADLNIERDQGSNSHLEDLINNAASDLGYQSHFFRRTVSMVDDHTSFIAVGIPAADIIDYDYGFNNSFWHTRQDTIDKLSSRSLQIVGEVLVETVRLLNK